MNRTLTCLFVSLVLLLGTMSLAAQEEKMGVTFAGDYNAVGGTYCFGGDDAKSINALWHVVGSRWRIALAAPENKDLRQSLRGKAREFTTQDGNTYYTIDQGECFFVPAPMRARVDLMSPIIENGGGDRGDVNSTPSPAPAPTPKLKPIIFWLIIALLCLAGWLFFASERRKEQIAKNREEADREMEARIRELEEKSEADKREWERNHPVESGPPVVAGGVEAVPRRERLAAVISEFSRTAAVSSLGTIASEWRVIGNIIHGRLVNCYGGVRYNTGSTPQPRHFVNEPALKALMEHVPTGERHMKFILWGCLNGCWTSMVEGALNFIPDTNETGEPVVFRPVVLAEPDDVAQYGKPVYDPRHDLVAAVAGREEAFEHFIDQLPNRRSRVFMG